MAKSGRVALPQLTRRAQSRPGLPRATSLAVLPLKAGCAGNWQQIELGAKGIMHCVQQKKDLAIEAISSALVFMEANAHDGPGAGLSYALDCLWLLQLLAPNLDWDFMKRGFAEARARPPS